MARCIAAEDWPDVLVSTLERSFSKKEIDYNRSKEYVLLFANCCSRKGLFDVEGELRLRVRQLCQKCMSLMGNDALDSDSRALVIQVLQCYVSHDEVEEFVEVFEPVGVSCLDFLKLSKKENVYSVAVEKAWSLLEHLVLRLNELHHIKSIRKGASALVSKIGTLCKQSFDQEHPSLGLLRCLRACLIAFPTSLKNLEKNFKGIAGSLLVQSEETAQIRAAAGDVFALLPRISGSGDLWSDYSQVLLVSIHKLLDHVLLGLEPEQQEDARFIDPSVSALDVKEKGKSEMVLFAAQMSAIIDLMNCLTRLISSNFSCPVPMPTRGLIELSRRILSVDATRIRRIERVGRTSGQVVSLGVHASRLQIHGLEILGTLMRVAKGTIIPHMCRINNMLARSMEQVCRFKSNASADIIDADFLLHLIQTLNASMKIDSISAVTRFAQPLLDIALIELSLSGRNSDEDELLLSNISPKNYHIRHQYSGQLKSNSISCQVEILQAFESMFMLGISIIQDDYRLRMEDFILHITKSAFCLADHKSLHTKGDCQGVLKLACAALKALAAAVSAPSVYRPSHAAEALAIFRKGTVSPIEDIRMASIKAVSSIEAFMHPKSLLLGTKIENTEILARNRHGMPSFWSFLEYDGVKRYIPAAETKEEKKVEQSPEPEETQHVKQPDPAGNSHKRKSDPVPAPAMQSKKPHVKKIAEDESPALEFKIAKPLPENPVVEKPATAQVMYQMTKLPPTEQDVSDDEDSLPDIDSGEDD